MKYMHMIHCVCLNRAQQLLTAMCLLFSAASDCRIRNLGLGGKIGTFLGPFWYFGPIWDQVPNSGPYRSACVIKNIQILQYFCQQKSFFFFNELPCFGQFVKYTLFGSPLALPPNFSLFRDPGPYRNRFGSLLGPNSYFRVPIFSVLASFTCTVFK